MVQVQPTHHFCIVLAAPHTPGMADLMEQLAEADCRVEQHADPATAFASLCCAQKIFFQKLHSMQRRRRSDGDDSARDGNAETDSPHDQSHSRDRPALIIIEPARWASLDAMLAARDRWLPCSVWSWNGDSLQCLREALDDEAIDAASSAAELLNQVAPRPRQPSHHELRLVKPFNDGSDQQESTEGEHGDASTVERTLHSAQPGESAPAPDNVVEPRQRHVNAPSFWNDPLGDDGQSETNVDAVIDREIDTVAEVDHDIDLSSENAASNVDERHHAQGREADPDAGRLTRQELDMLLDSRRREVEP